MAEERRAPIVVRDTGDLACAVPGPPEGIVRFGTDFKPVAETIDDLTEDVAPDENADYLMTWDASASRHKKVLLTNLPGGAGGETSGSSSSRSSESTSSQSSQSFSSQSSASLSSASSESSSSRSSESTSSKSSESTSSKSSQSFSSQSSASLSSASSLHVGGSISRACGIQLTNNNGSAVVIGAPVYSDAAGSYKKAKADAASTKNVIGLQLEASVNNAATGTIVTDGTLTATTTQWDAVCGTSGGLAAGTKYYLSAATAGLLTATAPSTVGQYICPVIIGLSTTQAKLLQEGDILV